MLQTPNFLNDLRKSNPMDLNQEIYVIQLYLFCQSIFLEMHDLGIDERLCQSEIVHRPVGNVIKSDTNFE